MKIKNLIKESIIRLLNEEIYGKTAIVYHGSRSGPKDMIDRFQKGFFVPGAGYGSVYGDGLYTVFQLKGTRTERGGYGEFMYKIKLNLDGFICFNDYMSIKVYGAPLTIREQLKTSGNERALSFIKSFAPKWLQDDCDMSLKDLAKKYDMGDKGDIEWNKKQYGIADTSSETFVGNFTDIGFENYVPGMLFFNPEDGLNAVCYDANAAILLGYKKYDEKDFKSIDKKSLKQNISRVFKKGNTKDLLPIYNKSELEKAFLSLRSSVFSRFPPHRQDVVIEKSLAAFKEHARLLKDTNSDLRDRFNFLIKIENTFRFRNKKADMIFILDTLFTKEEQQSHKLLKQIIDDYHR